MRGMVDCSGQLKQQLHFLVILDMEETPQTASLKAEMC